MKNLLLISIIGLLTSIAFAEECWSEKLGKTKISIVKFHHKNSLIYILLNFSFRAI